MALTSLLDRLIGKSSNSSIAIPEADKLRPVVVLGMHRSGTSALSGALQRLGVYFGETSDLFGGDRWNENGYYEYANLVDLNDELLASLGSAWDAPPLKNAR